MNSKRSLSLPLLTTIIASAALVLGACASGSGEPDEAASQAAAGDGFTIVDDDPVDYEACARISEDVQSLLEATMTCARDETCEAVPAPDMLADACLPSISCYVAVAGPVELDPVRAELRALDDEYREECGLCPVANCVPEERIYSQCEAGSCDLEARPDVVDDVAIANN